MNVNHGNRSLCSTSSSSKAPRGMWQQLGCQYRSIADAMLNSRQPFVLTRFDIGTHHSKTIISTLPYPTFEDHPLTSSMEERGFRNQGPRLLLPTAQLLKMHVTLRSYGCSMRRLLLRRGAAPDACGQLRRRQSVGSRLGRGLPHLELPRERSRQEWGARMNDEKSDRRTVRVCITGRVQGVCIRAWAQGNANALGLTGWVRNRRDGAVEALFSGAASQVFEVRRCRGTPSKPHADHLGLGA